MRVGTKGNKFSKYEDHEDYWDTQRDEDKKVYLRIVDHLRKTGGNTIVSIARAINSNTCTVERVVDYHRRSFRTEIIDTRGCRSGVFVELKSCLMKPA